MKQAERLATAQDVLDLLDQLGREGATLSPFVARSLQQAMRTTRNTVRNAEIS